MIDEKDNSKEIIAEFVKAGVESGLNKNEAIARANWAYNFIMQEPKKNTLFEALSKKGAIIKKIKK